MKKFGFNSAAQFGLVIFTLAGFLLTSLKLPQYGVMVSFVSQFFWLYSSYHAWKEAKQPGMFVNSLIVTVILFIGVINYWFIR